MGHISQAEAVNLIRSTMGGFFGVEFVKKDGSLRKMNARLGVKAYRKHEGRPSTTAHIPRYITVWDRTKKEYRTINVNTIRYLSCNKQKYSVA